MHKNPVFLSKFMSINLQMWKIQRDTGVRFYFFLTMTNTPRVTYVQIEEILQLNHYSVSVIWTHAQFYHFRWCILPRVAVLNSLSATGDGNPAFLDRHTIGDNLTYIKFLAGRVCVRAPNCGGKTGELETYISWKKKKKPEISV